MTINQDELCLFWDEIEAVFFSQIEIRATEISSSDKVDTLKKARKALYRAAKRASKGKELKVSVLCSEEETDD